MADALRAPRSPQGGSSKSLGRLPFTPARHMGPLAPAPRGGSPDLKASGLSWAPGSQALMGPTAEASWYWVSSRCSCAGLRVGNVARRFAQLIWGTRRSLWSEAPPPWHSHTPWGVFWALWGREQRIQASGPHAPSSLAQRLGVCEIGEGVKVPWAARVGGGGCWGGDSQQAPHPVLCPPDMLLVTSPRRAEKGGKETRGLGKEKWDSCLTA